MGELNSYKNENFNYKRNGLKVNLDLEFNKDATIEVILASISAISFSDTLFTSNAILWINQIS